MKCTDFDLEGTLTSGQVFRWRRMVPTPAYSGWINGVPVQIIQDGTEISFQGACADSIQGYLSLDVDLGTLTRQMDVDPVIHAALESHKGLRIIRQEPWECRASFILSAFNNIVRLTGMLDHLAVVFGERVAGGNPSVHRFPRPEVIATVSERVLRNCGLGFRAPYLKAAAQAVATGAADLEAWRNVDDDALRAALMAIPGIGEKVVECVMLFGYGRSGAFPVDVWIGRGMRAWYFRGRKVPDRKIRAFARRHFGSHCGWAQQYLFCYARGDGRLQ